MSKYGEALKYYAAETALTEKEIINIAARDDVVDLPAEELSIDELGGVLNRHKADILNQRQYRAKMDQRRAGVIAANAIEKVAAGTFLTESQLAHIVDLNPNVKLSTLKPNKLIDMMIESLETYKESLSGSNSMTKVHDRIDEGWIKVTPNDRLYEGYIRETPDEDELSEGWIKVTPNDRLDEGWIKVTPNDRLDEGWVEVSPDEVLTEGWVKVSLNESDDDEDDEEWNKLVESKVNEGPVIATPELNESVKENRFNVPFYLL